jgi:chaperonin GroEL (HSP60 family)
MSKRDVHERVTSTNIIVAKLFVNLIRSTLGPLGLHKIITDKDDLILVTRDGRTIFDNIEVAHPIEKLLIELTRSIDANVGDGTTSAVILTGELLEKAEELMYKGFHSTTIVKGYRKAEMKALQLLNKLAVPTEEEMIREAAITALNSRILDQYKDIFADMIVEAILSTMEDGEADPDHVYFERVEGESIAETKLIRGVIIESRVIVPHMPRKMKNAKIALLNTNVTLGEEEKDLRKDKQIVLNLKDSDEIEGMHMSPFDFYEGMANKIISVGADVVINQRRMNSIVMDHLSRNDILASTNVKKDDIEKISRATGAKIVLDINSLMKEDLGIADEVKEKTIGDFKFIFIDTDRAATILIRGGSRQVIDEVYRTLHDALYTAANVLNDSVLPGGGATEEYIARGLRKYAFSISTKEQLAVTAFAEALEGIPKTLAHNAGEDQILAIIQLRKRHEDGERFYGLDVKSGGIVNVIEEGIIDPLITKKRIIKGAVEMTQIILRADDYVPMKG